MVIGQEQEQKKTVILLDALKMIRKDIRDYMRDSINYKESLNIIDSIAMHAIHDYLKNGTPSMGNKND